jgi:hypothetical protein
MRILRSVAAIGVGLGFMAATAAAGTLLATAISGGPRPDGAAANTSMTYLVLNLITCGFGSVLGGWLAARIAVFAPYGHAAVMAAIIAVLSATVSVAPTPGEPGWYPSAIVLTAVVGILLGGKLRAAAAGGRVIA